MSCLAKLIQPCIFTLILLLTILKKKEIFKSRIEKHCNFLKAVRQEICFQLLLILQARTKIYVYSYILKVTLKKSIA